MKNANKKRPLSANVRSKQMQSYKIMNPFTPFSLHQNYASRDKVIYNRHVHHGCYGKTYEVIEVPIKKKKKKKKEKIIYEEPDSF